MKRKSIPIEDVRRMYLREFLTMKEIAKKYDVAEATIRRLLVKHEVAIRSRADIRFLERTVSEKSRAKYDEAEVCRLYVIDKLSTKEIAKRVGCTQPAVYYILKRCGIQTRGQTDSVRLVWSQRDAAKNSTPKRPRCRLNEDFFKTWSPEMAWVLGLLFTDGHMEQSRTKFCLTLKDWDVLHNVRELLGYTGPVHRVNKTEARRLTVCRKSVCDDLQKLGITPAKSHTVEWPAGMPPEMLRHFLRGCWDGDGCFSSSRSNALVARLVSGSKSFALQLWALLNTHLECFKSGKYKCSVTVIPEHDRVYKGKRWTQKELYAVSFGGNGAIQEFVDFLYEGVPLTTSMLRKRQLAEGSQQLRQYRSVNPWAIQGRPAARASL